METETTNLLVLDTAPTNTEPVVEFLHDIAKIDFVYRHIGENNELESTLGKQQWDLILFNSSLPDATLYGHVQIVKRLQPRVPLLVLLKTATVHEAVDLMRQGAQAVIERADQRRLIDLIQQELKTPTLRANAQNDPPQFDQDVLLAVLPESGLPIPLEDIEQANLNDAVIVTDMSLQIQNWNKAAERIYGWSEAEVLGRNSGVILGTVFRSAEDSQQVLDAIQAGRWWQGEVIHRHKDGSLIHVLGSVGVIHDKAGNPVGLLAVNRDITDQKRAEDAQRETEERYRLVAEHIKDVLARISMDGAPTFVSPSCFGLLGYRPEELVGQSGFEIVLPEDRPKMQAASETALASNANSFALEHRVLHKDGHTVWVELSASIVRDANGKPVEIIAITRDISERKLAEEARRESERRYRLLAENVKDVISVVAANGICTFMTPSCLNLLGYAPEELMGKPGLGIVHPDDWPQAQADLQAALASNLPYFRLERRLMHKDGHLIWVEINTTIVYDSQQGTPVELISVIRDITDRKEAEEVRKQYAAEVYDLYNRAPCGYHSLDADGLITQMNDTELGWLGYTREEVIGKLRAVDIHAAESIDILRVNLPILKETGSRSNIEVEFKRKDGTTFPVLLNATAVYDEDGTFLQSRSSVFDMTELKQAQNALRESEERYRRVVNTLSEGVVLQAQDSTILTYNAAAEQILGLSYDQIIGRTSVDPRWQAIHEDGSPFPGETHPAMITLATGEPQSNVVMGIRKPDDSQVWLLINSQPLFEAGQARPSGVVTSFADISRLIGIENELRILSQRLQLATETGGIGVWEWYIHNDDLVWDGEMFKLYGISRKDFTGKSQPMWNSGLLYPDDFNRMQAEMQAALMGKDGLDTEFRIIRPDGQVRHLKVKAVLFRGKEGQPERMVGVNWDITLLKQAEEGLRFALEKEKEVGELKSRFVSVASHEFRTPLAAILATSETLAMYRTRMDDAQIDSRLGKIRQQVFHMTQIMDDVLQLARIQAKRIDFQPVDTDLHSLCLEIIEEFEVRAEYRDRIRYGCQDEVVMARIDLRLMRHILSNLVSNALKYSPPDLPIEMELSQDAERIRLRVSDKGIGIPPKDRERLFEPFYRAGNVGEISGTGLGLTITREAVLAHNGSITVESEVGKGTTFTVVLPLTRQETAIVR